MTVREAAEGAAQNFPDGASADAAGRRFLGEILVASSLLTRAQLDDALLKQQVSGKRLGTLLVELGALDERDLATALGEHFGVAVVDLRRRAPDPDAVQLLNETVARSLRALPLTIMDDVLQLVVADPSDQQDGQFTATVEGREIDVRVASTGTVARSGPPRKPTRPRAPRPRSTRPTPAH